MSTAPELSVELTEKAPPNDGICDDKTYRADNTTGQEIVYVESYTDRATRRGFLLTLQEFMYPQMERIPVGRFLFLFFFATIP